MPTGLLFAVTNGGKRVLHACHVRRPDGLMELVTAWQGVFGIEHLYGQFLNSGIDRKLRRDAVGPVRDAVP